MRLLLCAVIVVALAAPASAETYEAVPTADTYIWINYGDRNYGRHQTLAFGSGAPRYNDDRFQSLIKWPLPKSLRGAKVASARIVLAVRFCGPGDGTADMYLLKSDWTENATW